MKKCIVASLVLFAAAAGMCYAAPLYGPDMPKRGRWYAGLETNLVFRRDMDKNLGRAGSNQYFFDLSYGLYDWFAFDGRLGIGDMEYNPVQPGKLDLGLGFSGAYGLRFRLYDDAAQRMRVIMGFQHISAHPPQKEVSGVKYASIWDEWQLSFLLSKGFGKLEPYAGVKASQLFIIWKDDVNDDWKWNGAKDHFGLAAGSKFDINRDWYLNVEARFIDETAVSAAIIYKNL